MKLMDVIYRAFTEYRKNTKDSKECNVEKNYIRSSDVDKDSIQFVSYNLKIDSDWIEAIEEGLKAVEKCIQEERQFIRVNGEVVKIEKVKRVSKESVTHLAKHSNLIRRDTGEDIVPDELFMVEKLSDYAVYENRFLYLLLTYLKNFILFRYNKIVEYSNKYCGTLAMDKSLNYANKKLKYNVNLVEEIDDDEYRIKNNPNKDIIDRIKNLLTSVTFYLSTELMVGCSKVPMIRPPIVKTNVLRKNQNFKKAVELYDFITTYDKDGYEINENKKIISPFTKEIADEFAETVKLHSFLTYEYANGINKELKQNYAVEEQRRKEEENIKHQQQLKVLRKKINDSQLSMEEYMLELEKRNRILENDSLELSKSKQEINKLNSIINELNRKIDGLEDEVKGLNDTIKEKILEIEKLIETHKIEIEELENKHAEEINNLIDTYNQKEQELINTYDEKIKEINEQHRIETVKLKESFELKIEEVKSQYLKQIEEINIKHQKEVDDLVKEREDIIAKNKLKIEKITTEYENSINKLNADHEYLVEKLKKQIVLGKETIDKKQKEVQKYSDLSKLYYDEKHVLMAELEVYRSEKGRRPLAEDFTSEERFKELETEFAKFKIIFKSRWQKTKKRIYSELKQSILPKK